jgi:uncharacterized lipoprotein YehR (DUF1307 family)
MKATFSAVLTAAALISLPVALTACDQEKSTTKTETKTTAAPTAAPDSSTTTTTKETTTEKQN